MSRARGIVLASVIVTLVLAALMGTSVLNAVVAERTIDAAAQDSYEYVGDLMSERVADFAGAASDVVEGTVSEIARRQGDLSTESLVHSLADRLEREPAVGAIFVGWPDGRVLSLARTPSGFLRLSVEPRQGGGSSVSRVQYDSALNAVEETAYYSGYELAGRDWYDSAIASRDLEWTEPYVSVRTGEVTVSPVEAARVYGQVIAVVGADLDVALLGQLLEDIPIGDDARAFILTGEGKVVAAPTGARGALARAVEDDLVIPDAEDIGIPEVAPLETPAPGGTGEALSITGDTVSLEQSLDPETGLDWVLHLDARAEDLTPTVATMTRATVAITSVSILLVVIAVMVALRLWRPIRVMRQRAETDALTGLSNRYEYGRRGRVILRGARQSGAHVLLVAFDLDDFKPVNDVHGHDAGDVVIAAVGDALRESVRTRDLAARTGGDEFVVVMELEGKASPVEVARRLRDDVEAAIAESSVAGAAVGVTAGFATSAVAGYDLRVLQSAADEALVSGKRVKKGRTYAFGHRAGSRAEPVATGSLPGN